MLDNKEPIDVDAILPYGEKLRPLILSSCLSKTDLKRTLAQRGIFISNSQPECTVPSLLTTLLSPREFENLKERQKSKEDNVKRHTQSILLNEDIELSEAIDEIDFDIHELFNEDYSSYEIIGVPSFTVENKNLNEISLTYQIERNDLTKNWIEHASIHEGNIIFQRQEDNNVKIIMEYTSAETKEVNEKVKQFLVREFKNQGFIGRDVFIEKITASKFQNEKRNEFLMSLLRDKECNTLVFKEVTNVEIGPDASKTVLPQKIEWMKDYVNNLILKGKALHNMEFFKEEIYRNALIIEEIEAVYKFEYRNIKGECKITFGFPKLLKNKGESIEFQFHIQVNTGGLNIPVSKREIEKVIFNAFDIMKEEIKLNYIS
ncbi:GapS4b family protein [Bacillus cereus]|uniref:GapS4b family protein n=1 Tax=Bacillus cereus TaxID=1396 RepID=UPI000BF819B9|nr:hypothetical protein [Bacillus cereus]HDX9528504.1 hypothetical protein [Bacillus thuringiensis]MCU5243550.1 hypothetical protein [Bacillus cereus]MEC1982192.1 hypothetical protein [Bacillus cereus]PEV31091.1 hypothetical protein CN430_03070 [Bacillus cereus]PEY46700.1 hypothetical protein CN348_28935 [Bacillus cereus]